MAGKQQAYQDYKNSNVGWMGAVPSHWEILPCRSVVNNLVDKNEGAKDQNYLSLMANVGVILYDDKGDVGNKKPDDLSKCKIVKKGNLVINSMNYAIGSYGMSVYDGVCSPVYIVLDINSEIVEQRFALRLFENSTFQKYLATFGNGILEHRAAIGWDDIKGAYIPLPTKLEQKAILSFLDHETAKIDTLIAKQQQLIALLKEKRQAVISHAVTKGLNPNAPMRDSGVEWLGEVPANWKNVSRIKYISSLKGRQGWQGLKAEEYLDEGPYVVSSAHFTNHQIQWDDCPRVSPARYERDSNIQLDKNDLLLMKDGAAMGKLAYVDELPDKACINSHLLLFRPLNRSGEMFYNPRFMFYFMQTELFQEHIKIYGTGVTFLGISQQAIGNYRLVFPSISEQQEIIEFLEQETQKLNDLAQKQENMMALLQERRTALISAAVTGKIDVRDWQAK